MTEQRFPTQSRTSISSSHKKNAFLRTQVEADRTLFATFDIPDADNVPVRVDLTFPEFLDLYQKRFNATE